MAVTQISFQRLLWSMAYKAGLNPDPALGTVYVTNFHLASWADFLTDAALWAWKPDPARPELIWPFTVKTKSGVSISGGAIARSALEDSDWWRLWSEDNRSYSASPGAYPIADTSDGVSIYPRVAAASLPTPNSVFAYYRQPRPLFTHELP